MNHVHLIIYILQSSNLSSSYAEIITDMGLVDLVSGPTIFH